MEYTCIHIISFSSKFDLFYLHFQLSPRISQKMQRPWATALPWMEMLKKSPTMNLTLWPVYEIHGTLKKETAKLLSRISELASNVWLSLGWTAILKKKKHQLNVRRWSLKISTSYKLSWRLSMSFAESSSFLTSGRAPLQGTKLSGHPTSLRAS